MPSFKFSKKGSALVLILAICGVLAVFTGAIGLGAIGNLRIVSGESADDQARFIAQAGVQAALTRLAQPRNWPSAARPKGEGDVWSCVDYNYDEDHLGLWSSSNPSLHAAVLVYNNTNGAFHRTTQGPDGTDIPEGRVLIISSGIVDGDTRGERQSTTVAALAKPAGVLFEDALLGGTQVTVNNSFVDVVDSSVAGWTPAGYSPYDINATPTREASIASNNTATNSIQFDATSQVDGDVFSGPNSTLGAIGYYGATITGTDGTLTSDRDLNLITAPPTATPLGAWDATYGAGSTSLAGDTYHVRGDLIIGAGADLTVTSTTTIYVDGNVSIDNAAVNMNGAPWHLQIFMTGGAGSAANLANSSVSALVSGPNSTVSVQNTNLFGAAIGDRLTVLNSGIHYDRAVSGLFLGTTGWTTDVFLSRATTDKLAITAPPGGPPPDPFTTRPPLPAGPGPAGPGPTGPGPTGPGPTGPGPTGPGPTGPGPTGPGPTGPGPTGPGPGPAPAPTGTPAPPPPGNPPPGNGGSGIPNFPLNPQCCLDYSCGPPMCMIY